jgi:hypothetical protein
MYLAVRSVRVHTAQIGRSVEFAQKLIPHLRDKHGAQLRASMNVAGAANTVIFSSRWESLGDYQTFSEAVLADTAYMKMLGEVSDIAIAGTEDSSILNMVRPAGEPNNFTSVVQANINQEPMEAMAWAFEIAEYVADLTGNAVGVASTVLGNRSTIGWVSGIEGLAQYQTMGEVLEQDPGYLGLIKRAQGLFTSDGYQATLWRTIA